MAVVGEAGHKNASGFGVYFFTRDLIVEGKDAWFVNDTGRFAIDWVSSPMRYNDYKSKDKNISKRKASNNLRSALLNFYEKEGAKEYKDGQKKNEKGEIIERQFQMPPRIFGELFGSDVLLTDDGSEQETESIESEVCQSSKENSSDTGFDEAMDTSCDDLFNKSELDIDPLTLDIPTDESFSFVDNTEIEEICPDPLDVTTTFKMFSIPEEELKKPLDDKQGVVEGIFPSAGSVQGGLPFVITLTEKLPEDDTLEIYLADFVGVGVVGLEKLDPFTLSGSSTPSSLDLEPGLVCVTVKTQAGQLLGSTSFRYVDLATQELLKQLVEDQALQSLYFTLWSQKQSTFGSDSSDAQNQDPFSMQDQGSSNRAQGLKVLYHLLLTAAQTNAGQFIQMIFSTSAGKLIFDTYKNRTQLLEDVARASGHDDLACYIQDVNRRLLIEGSSDAQSYTINWLELVTAVNKIQKQACPMLKEAKLVLKNRVCCLLSAVAEDETELESGEPEDEDKESDYFADAETSSSGSFELEDGWSDSDDGDGHKWQRPTVKSSPWDGMGYGSFWIPSFWTIIAVVIFVLLVLCMGYCHWLFCVPLALLTFWSLLVCKPGPFRILLYFAVLLSLFGSVGVPSNKRTGKCEDCPMRICQEMSRTMVEYWNGTHCAFCLPCPRGYGVKTKCSSKQNTECHRCWPGFDYSNTTGFDGCIECDQYSNFLPGSHKKVKNCTTFSPHVCDGCEDGDFFYPNFGENGGCFECSPPCSILEDETRSCSTAHDRRCTAKSTEPTSPILSNSSTGSAKEIANRTDDGGKIQPKDPATQLVKNLSLGVATLVIALAVAMNLRILILRNRKQDYLNAGAAATCEEGMLMEQRTTLMSLAEGVSNTLIKHLTNDERRFITQRLNGRHRDGYMYWTMVAKKLGICDECESWKNSDKPTETFLEVYGEKEGSTIKNLTKALRDPKVELTKIAKEIEEKFSPRASTR